MKRLISHLITGNNISIIEIGLDNGLQDINGNPLLFDSYEQYVNAGFLGNRAVFDFVKSGKVFELISQSPYIEIVDNKPVYRLGIEFELLQFINNQVKQNRLNRYQNLIDPYTLEYTRKDITTEIEEITKQELKDLIKAESLKIKLELPYYDSIVLL